MDQLRQVMAAIDFSQSARNAAQRAARLCRESGARLDLMHAPNLPRIGTLPGASSNIPTPLEHDVVTSARQGLKKQSLTILKRYGVRTRVHVEPGSAFSMIVASAKTTNADLIVVGSRGSGSIRRQLLGSTAVRLSESSPFPVLVVKRAPTGPYRTVLVPVDFSPHSLPALRTARLVAPGADIS